MPNTNITREQFEIEEDTEFERHWPRARASCIVDVNSGLILTSEFDTTKVIDAASSASGDSFEHHRISHFISF